MKRLNETEGLLFVVLRGVNVVSEEGKGAGRGEETWRRETVGAVHWQRPQHQADLLSQPADWGLPTKQAGL